MNGSDGAFLVSGFAPEINAETTCLTRKVHFLLTRRESLLLIVGYPFYISQHYKIPVLDTCRYRTFSVETTRV